MRSVFLSLKLDYHHSADCRVGADYAWRDNSHIHDYKVIFVSPVLLVWHFHMNDRHKGKGSLLNMLLLKCWTKLIFDRTKLIFYLIPGNLHNLSSCSWFHKYLLIICDSISLLKRAEFYFYKQKSLLLYFCCITELSLCPHTIPHSKH